MVTVSFNPLWWTDSQVLQGYVNFVSTQQRESFNDFVKFLSQEVSTTVDAEHSFREQILFFFILAILANSCRINKFSFLEQIDQIM